MLNDLPTQSTKKDFWSRSLFLVLKRREERSNREGWQPQEDRGMANNPVKPDQGGDIDEKFFQALLDSGILSFGLRGNYKCGECREEKAEKKTVNKKAVSISHCCSAILARVQENAKKHEMIPSQEGLKMHLKQLEGRMHADPQTEQSKKPRGQAEQSKKPRGPYKCGCCQFPKKWHCKWKQHCTCKTKRTTKTKTLLKP